MIKIIGYVIFGISIIIWLSIFVIPWLGYSKGQIAGIIAGLVIAGEITFYLGLFLLGKTFYEKIKKKLFFWKVETNAGLNATENKTNPNLEDVI